MKIVKKTTIKEISTEILTICTDDKISYKDAKKGLWDLFTKLRRIKISSESKMKDLIHLHRELSKIKNTKAFFREEEIAKNILVYLPMKIRELDEEYDEDFLDEEDSSLDREALKVATQLVKYGKEIIASKDDKSKRYSNRVREALNWMTHLYEFYEIEGMKEILQPKITNKDEMIQYYAVFGLAIYYSFDDADELEDKVKKQLEKLTKTAKKRAIVS